jgi:hypothetical protein
MEAAEARARAAREVRAAAPSGPPVPTAIVGATVETTVNGALTREPVQLELEMLKRLLDLTRKEEWGNGFTTSAQPCWYWVRRPCPGRHPGAAEQDLLAHKLRVEVIDDRGSYGAIDFE